MDKPTVHPLQILNGEVQAVSPEGKTASMPLVDWLAKIAPRRMDCGGVVLPDGIKTTFSEGGVTVWVHEIPPRIYSFDWIRDDSPADFGSGTTYRPVRIALPYLILVAVFVTGPNGQLILSRCNECFFRVAPLQDVDASSELLYPCLYNCSKFTPPEGRPLSWLCTQYLDFARLEREPSLNRRLRQSFEALRHCLLETSFNRSSEHHEGCSWFAESRQVDPRVNSIQAWEAATEEDPLFVLKVPWLKTGLTVRQLVERIFRNCNAKAAQVNTSAAMARVVFNYKLPA